MTSSSSAIESTTVDGYQAAGHDHGIYLEGANNARVTDNVFYNNADWGIHLYPDAEGSYIAYNVVDGNGRGLIFAGEAAGGEYGQPYASDNNIVELNIISNSTVRYNVDSWWGGPVGTRQRRAAQLLVERPSRQCRPN